MSESIMQWALAWLAGNPNMAVIFSVVAIARAIFKPACAMIQSYVDATPSIKDNQKWAAIKANKYFKAFAYALDYLLSIKLPK